MNLIKLKNVSKIYGKDEGQTIALDKVSLDVAKQDFLAVMGPSGSGKSTLLNIIGCMDKPTEGEYWLNDRLVNNMTNKELSIVRNKTVSFIFQHFALMKDYSIYENVELPLLHRKLSQKEKKEIIMYYLRELGIENQVYKKPKELSGGQQQRASIARALASQSDIILADEPTGALDQKTGEELMELLTRINNNGKTIIVITHDPRVAAYCKRTITIKDGILEEI